MMRRLIITLTIIIAALSAQAQWTYPIGTPTWYKKVRVDSVFWLNTVDTVHSYATLYPGALMARTTTGDTSLYMANGIKWVRIGSASAGGGTIDSAYRSNDTLFFRSASGEELVVKMDYYTKGESDSRFLQITDTVGMLNNYVRGAEWDAAYDTMHLQRGAGDIKLPALSWHTKLTPLMTELDIPIQPTDSIPSALGKLQAQIDAFFGRWIENQDTGWQLAKFRLNGASTMSSQSGAAYPLNIQRYSYSQPNAIVAFRNANAARLGYMGLGSAADTMAMFLSADRGRLHLLASDTNSITFGNVATGGSPVNSYTFYRNGHWFFYRNPQVPEAFETSLYSPTYQLYAEGYSRFDSTTTATSYLNGRAMLYKATAPDTLDVQSLNTNWNYRIQMRMTGGINYTGLFIKGSNGNTGIGTTTVPEKLSVGGNIDLNGVKIITGNGTPEGAVSAPVGSMYLRKDGGPSSTLYIKESGTGNTGWAAK